MSAVDGYEWCLRLWTLGACVHVCWLIVDAYMVGAR